jgi:hypothetical protein
MFSSDCQLIQKVRRSVSAIQAGGPDPWAADLSARALKATDQLEVAAAAAELAEVEASAASLSRDQAAEDLRFAIELVLRRFEAAQSWAGRSPALAAPGPEERDRAETLLTRYLPWGKPIALPPGGEGLLAMARMVRDALKGCAATGAWLATDLDGIVRHFERVRANDRAAARALDVAATELGRARQGVERLMDNLERAQQAQKSAPRVGRLQMVEPQVGRLALLEPIESARRHSSSRLAG